MRAGVPIALSGVVGFEALGLFVTVVEVQQALVGRVGWIKPLVVRRGRGGYSLQKLCRHRDEQRWSRGECRILIYRWRPVFNLRNRKRRQRRRQQRRLARARGTLNTQ